MVRRIEWGLSRRGTISNEYVLTGLVEKLKALEPQFRQVVEEAKARRKALVKPGYKPPVKPEAAA